MGARAIERKGGAGLEVVEQLPSCPKCGSQELWRHGKNSAGTRQWFCKTCKKVFVVEPYLKKDVVEIADRMLAEEIAVPVISKVLDGFVSRRWLYERRKQN